jgi:hypothetical protein
MEQFGRFEASPMHGDRGDLTSSKCPDLRLRGVSHFSAGPPGHPE